MSKIKSARNETDMLNPPFFKKLLIFALPLMATGILQIIYNVADIVVVGKFAGHEALAAVGSTSALINLILNLFIGLATGTGVVTANLIGAEEHDALRKNVHTAMLTSVICGVFVGVFGFVFSRFFLTLMDSPADVIDLSTLYLKIYFLGAPASMVYNFGAAIVRSNGDTKRPLVILAALGIVNVVLNIVLVICFHLDVAGVAIATIISQYISAVFIVRRLRRLPNACRLSIRNLRIHSKSLKKIMTIGIPAVIQGVMFSLSTVIIQSTVNSFGSIAVAGCSAAMNIDNFIYCCCNSVSQTAMNFTSQNTGAVRYENIRKIYLRCMALTVVTALLLTGISLMFPAQILSIFSSDSEVIRIGIERTQMVVTLYVFCALMDLACCQLRGMGRSIEAMLITLIGSCGLRILWIFAVVPFKRTLANVFVTYPITWIITFAVLQICCIVCLRKLEAKKRGKHNVA